MTEAPLVSVVMPVHDGAAFIGESIDSVVAQDYPRWELLVIDDASTDGTADVVRAKAARDSRILFFGVKHASVSRARNEGLAAAKGTFVAFLDSDDLYFPDTLSRFLREFTNADVIAAHGSFTVIDQDGKPKAPWTSASILTQEHLFTGAFMAHVQKFMFRRAALEKLEGFDARYDGAEDQQFLARLLASGQGSISAIPEPVFRYRYHMSSTTRSRANYERILDNNLALLSFMLDDARFGPALEVHKAAAYTLRYQAAARVALQGGENVLARRFCLRALREPCVPTLSFLRFLAPLWLLTFLPRPLFAIALSVWRRRRAFGVGPQVAGQ